MNTWPRSVLKWLDPKSILFGVAVFNFMLLWFQTHTMRCAGVACPWYYPWSYFNEPTILLVAAFFLFLGRIWSYALSSCLSGYLVGQLISLYVVHDLSPLAMLLDPDARIIYEWQTQYILASAILLLTAFYLVRAVMSNLSSQNRHPTGACSGLG